MGLRNRIPQAVYQDPVNGIDLRVSPDDLLPGFAFNMTNQIYRGRLEKRYGSVRLSSTQYNSSLGGRGGYRFYYGASSKARLIAYSNRISQISDAGAETILTSGQTSDQDTHFWTWSIQDAVYVTNNTDTPGKVDNTVTFSQLSGANIPSSPLMIRSLSDRLFAAQGATVRSTDPRVDNRWSPSTSSWATFRPAGSGGNVTALSLHSATGQQGDPLAQLLVFQSGSVFAITGTDFGDDVTSATPSTNWDAAITLLDAVNGTNSPYSVVTAGGIGTFWLNQKRQVCWMPPAANRVLVISDRLFSNRSDIYGLNNINSTAIGQVIGIYHDRFYKLMIPLSNNTYATYQFWLDLTNPGDLESGNYKWYGPMTGQSLRRVWVEDQSGDEEVLYSIEGNSTTGVYVYRLNEANTWTDASGTSDNDVQVQNATYYEGFGADGYEKAMPLLVVDASGYINNARVGVNDLHGTLVSGLQITKSDGTAFGNVAYGNDINYGTGYKYGQSAGNNLGYVSFVGQGWTIPLGDRLQVITTHTTGRFQLNTIRPHVQLRKTQPFS